MNDNIILMTFLGGILWLIEELLTFVLPIFYTFRALMADRDKPVKIKMVLKYWCILSLYFLLRVALENVIEEY